MTNKQHPITPPPELVEQWDGHGKSCSDAAQILATAAAQWGADQELEACCEYIRQWFADPQYRIAELRNARRPKPPSLKESALNALEHILRHSQTNHGANTIRRALEQLND